MRPAVKEIFEDPKNKHIKMGTRHNIATPDGGSTIGVIPVIASAAALLEIHGWDHYLSSDPAKKGYVGRLLDLLFGCPNYRVLPFSNITRAIYNFHYGYRFSIMPSIINHGFTAHLSSSSTKAGKKINARFNRIFYSNYKRN
jgi:hypothetical protein